MSRNPNDQPKPLSHTDQTATFFQMLEAACESAIKRANGRKDTSPWRLVKERESAEHLALTEREIQRMIATRQLRGVRHGRRLMLDIRDLDACTERRAHAAEEPA